MGKIRKEEKVRIKEKKSKVSHLPDTKLWDIVVLLREKNQHQEKLNKQLIKLFKVKKVQRIKKSITNMAH